VAPARDALFRQKQRSVEGSVGLTDIEARKGAMNEAMDNLSAVIAENMTLSNVTNEVSNISGIPTLPMAAAPSHGLVAWILHLIASLILGITRLFVWALSFATITIPTLIFKILSVSFTLTLNFSSL
jgi:hypothetical protein